MTVPHLSHVPRGRLQRNASRPAEVRASFSPVAAMAEVFRRVEWSPALLAFLYYYFVVITYYLPGADIAIVISLFALLFRMQSIRIGKVVAVMGAWVCWAWLSFLGSSRQDIALEQTWTLTKLWIVAFVAFNVIRTRAQLLFFLTFASACFVLFPLRGAFVNYFGGYDMFGRALWNYAYSNSNDLAAFALIFASIAAALMIFARNRLTKVVALAAAGLMVLLIFFTQSRGTLLATGLVGMTLGLSRLRNPKVLLGILAVGAVSAYLAPAGVWSRLGGLSNLSVEGGMRGVDQEGSAEQRFQILKIAARISVEHPLLGTGAGTYQVNHALYARSTASESATAGGLKDAHNTYLSTAAELGFVGLGIFLALCLGAIWRTLRVTKRRQQRDADMLRMLTYGVVGFLLAGIFASLQYINVLHLHLVLMESAVLATASTVPAIGQLPIPPRRTRSMRRA